MCKHMRARVNVCARVRAKSASVLKITFSRDDFQHFLYARARAIGDDKLRNRCRTKPGGASRDMSCVSFSSIKCVFLRVIIYIW